MVLFGCGVYNKLTIFYKNSIKALKSLFILFHRFYNSLNLYARGIVWQNYLLEKLLTNLKEYLKVNIHKQGGIISNFCCLLLYFLFPYLQRHLLYTLQVAGFMNIIFAIILIVLANRA